MNLVFRLTGADDAFLKQLTEAVLLQRADTFLCFNKNISCASDFSHFVFHFLGFDTRLNVPRLKMGSAQTSSRFQFSQSWNTWLTSIKVEDVIVVAMTKYYDKPFVHFQLNKIQLKMNKEPYILFLAAKLAPHCSTAEWEMSDKWFTSKITLWMLLKTFPVNNVFKVSTGMIIFLRYNPLSNRFTRKAIKSFSQIFWWMEDNRILGISFSFHHS